MDSRAELARLLDQPFGPDHEGESAWTESLGRWLLAHAPAGGCRTDALLLLNGCLESHPRSADLKRIIRSFASHSSGVRLLAETGLSDSQTLTREALQRLVDKAVPRLDPAGDLLAWLDRLELAPSDAAWVAGLPEELIAPWAELFSPVGESKGEAAQLLAFRAAALGLSRGLLRHQPQTRDLDSPFAELPGLVSAFLAGQAPPFRLRELLDRCEACLAEAHAHLEGAGVSTTLVFQLDLLEGQLGRLRRLLLPEPGAASSLLVELMEGSAAQRRLRPLLRTGLKRLARKVVEHTGETGEHYLARDADELRSMGRGAAGGGALTALTAIIKLAISHLSLAPGLQGLALAANYAGSFTVMQFLHLTLASKQPAATAASLAAVLETPGTEDEVELVAAASRGQVVATLGNILLAAPVALLLDFLWRMGTGHTFVGAAKSAKLLAELHPLRSATVLFAAFTGFLLWLGSLAGGWAANWSAYRDLPEAVAHSPRLRALLGRRRARSLGMWLGEHFSGLFTCLVLGLLLGFLPVLLAFGGIPLEVRHVTLSAASAALAMGPGLAAGQVPWGEVCWAMLGVGIIGFLNFGVSFACSLRLALRARGVEGLARQALLVKLWKAFWKRPSRFLWKVGPKP